MSEDRIEQFKHEVADLGLRAPGDATERPWFVGGVALVIGGIVAILVGWYGASGSSQPYEQLPYLLSGGFLGVALATVGAAFVVRASLARYLRFWFIRQVYEQRIQTDRTVAALGGREADTGVPAEPMTH